MTDGSVSPDGTRFALRDYVDAEVFDGLPPGADAQTVYLPLQLQGEAMTWTQDGAALLVASERDDRLLRVDGPRSGAGRGRTQARAPPRRRAVRWRPRSGLRKGRSSPLARTGQLPVVLLAGGLLLAAGGVIAIAEWARRRGPVAPRG